MGQKLLSLENISTANGKIEIDLSGGLHTEHNVPCGIYFIQLKSGDELVCRRILLQKV
jgi:hypothetical protein